MDEINSVIADVIDLGERLRGLHLDSRYREIVRSYTGVVRGLVRLSLDKSKIPGKHREELASARTFKMLIQSGFPRRDSEIQSGFIEETMEEAAVRSLAPGESIDLPSIGPKVRIDEHDEARAYSTLMNWLSEGPRPFWESRADGVVIRVEPLHSDPTIVQVGWYDEKDRLVRAIRFDIRFTVKTSSV